MRTTSIDLKPDEVKKLRQLRKQHKSFIVRDRAHVILLKAKRKTIKEISEVLERSENFVKNSLSLYKKHSGIAGLLILRKGGNNRKLTAQEKDKIRDELDKSPRDYGYQEGFWNLKIFKDFLLKNYRIKYKSDQSYYDLLKYAGYSYQRPLKKDKRQDPHMVKRFEKNIIKKTQRTSEFDYIGSR